MGSDTDRVEWSGYLTEGKFTRWVGNLTTESSQKGSVEDREWVSNSNIVTQNQVRAGGGFGFSAAIATSRQCWYWIPTGGESYRGGTYMLQRGIQGLGDGGIEQAQGRD